MERFSLLSTLSNVPQKSLVFFGVVTFIGLFFFLAPTVHGACQVQFTTTDIATQESSVSTRWVAGMSCSSPNITNAIYNFNNRSTDSIEYKAVCLGSCGETSVEQAQAGNTGSAATGGSDSPFGDCFTIPGGFHVPQCVGHLSYGIFTISGHAMAGAGILFDYLLHFGISPNIINQQFVTGAWEKIRDLANMAFIFILLWISIATILRVPKNTAKDLLSRLIIVALLINFSLFITRVIIDVGNMAALFFYDSFQTTDIGNLQGRAEENTALKSDAVNRDGREVKGISTALMTKVNPQQMLQEREDLADIYPWRLVFLYVASFTMMFYMAWIFFITGFLFLSRIVVLWILMAASPLAFVSMILPQSSSSAQKYFWKELVGKSFCIVIFLFFVWLAVIFADPANATDLFLANDDTSGLNFLEFLIVLALKFGVIILLLKYGKDQTDKRCGSFAGTSLDIAKRVGALAGGAIGLAAGGVGGAALRKFVGGAATNLAGNKGLRQKLGTSAAGRLALRGMDKASTSSFDIRKTSLGSTMGTNKGVGAWGVKRGEGGYAGKAEARKKEFEKLSTSFGDKDDPKAIAARKKLADKLERKSLPTLQKVGMSWRKGGAIGDSIVGGMLKSFGGDQWGEVVDTEMESRAAERKQKDKESLEKHEGMRGAQSAGQKGATGAAKTILKQVKAGEQMQIEKERDKERFDKEKDALLARKGNKDDMAQSILQKLPGKDAAPESWKAGTEDALGDLNRTLRGINVALKQEAKREKDLMTTLGGLSTNERTGSQGRDIERQLRESRDKTLANEERKIEFEETKKDLERLSKRAEKESRDLRKVFENSGGDKKDTEKK